MAAMAGSALVGAALWGQQIYNNWKSRRIGIYGASMVGKTTLDRYMTTPGEMEEIPVDERTDHFKLLTRYILPKPTRKRLRWQGERRVVHSSDIGGEDRFWNLWIDDMVSRQCDRFFDDKAATLWQQGRIGEHKIFDPFRDDLVRLQKAGVPTNRAFMATRIGWNVEQTLFDMLNY